MSISRYRILAVVLGLLVARPAFATFHEMQMEQIVAGVGGDVSAQAIQLRSRLAFQSLVSQGRLVAHDAAGANPVILLDLTTNTASNASGARILIVSASMAPYISPAVAPDFVLTTPIPANYLLAGSLTWEDKVGTVYWRVSWGGASYTGTGAGSITNDADGNFSPPFAGALPFGSNKALRFPGLNTAASTNNAADYALTPTAAVLTNNAGASGTVTLPAACSITPGIDLLVTPPSGTTFQTFADAPIPAGFFDAGSDPFSGVVTYTGLPIAPGTIGQTDMIVRRMNGITLAGTSTSGSTPIQIVALSLVSMTPITVTHGGINPEQWNVTACLSGPAAQPLGNMSVTAGACVCPEGGTFSATLPVLPKLIFTRVGPPATQVLDFGSVGRPAIQFNTTGHWLNVDPGLGLVTAPPGLFVDHDLDGGTPPVGPLPPTTNFFEGARADRCSSASCAGPVSFKVRVTHDVASSARHDVFPPTTSCGVDTDGDGFCDFIDNCPTGKNPSQADTDDDGVGDLCDNCGALYNPCQEDVNANGIGDICETASVGGGGSSSIQLSEPAPNPTNGALSFSLTLPSDMPVQLGIYDLSGRLVRTLANGSLGSGPHTFNIDLANDRGRFGAGIYYLRLDAAGQRQVRSFVVVR